LVRLGFAASRLQARQLITHGHWMINGRKVNIPSYQVRPEEIISIRSSSSASDTVRRFGGRMVRDHSHANDVLKGLARRKHVVLPGDIGGKNQAVYNRLSRLSGPAFDRAYMRDMVEDHQEDVAEFRKASLTARDPDVRRFAASTLPTLQAHLMMAREGARTVSMRGGHGVMRRGRM